jgi:Secretion system C-terminal sorting domain
MPMIFGGLGLDKKDMSILFRNCFSLLIGVLTIGNSIAQRHEIETIKFHATEQDEVSGKPWFPDRNEKYINHKYYNKANQLVAEVKFVQYSDTSIIKQISETSNKYNLNGLLSASTYVSEYDNLIRKTTVNYDYGPSGKPIRTESINYSGNNPSKKYSQSVVLKTYNAKDSLSIQRDSTLIDYEANKWQVYVQKYEYDDKNRLKSIGYSLNPNAENFQTTTKYIYLNGVNIETKITKYYYNGAVIQTDTLINSTNNIGRKEESRNPYGGITINQFNKKNQLIETSDSASYKISKNKYFYNTENLIDKEFINYDDTFSGYAHINKYEFETIYIYDNKKRKQKVVTTGWFKSNNGGYPFRKFFFQNSYTYEYSSENKEKSNRDDLLIFPNPAIDKIQIRNSLGIECIRQISITNVVGTEVFRQSFPKKEISIDNQIYFINGICNQTIQLPPLAKGIYFVNIVAGNGELVGKKLMISNFE